MQLLDQSDAGQPAHVVVGHQEVIAVTLESVPGESAIFSGVHVVAGVKQHFGAESADVRLVIHHKNALGWICPASDRRTADSIKRNSKKPAHTLAARAYIIMGRNQCSGTRMRKNISSQIRFLKSRETRSGFEVFSK